MLRRLSKKNVISLTIFMITVSGSCFPLHDLVFETSDKSLQQLLQDRITTAKASADPTIEKEPIKNLNLIQTFYERRSYRPAWIGENKSVGLVKNLLKSIRKADREALDPKDYHLDALEKLANSFGRNRSRGQPPILSNLVDLELLSTDAFLTYASHLLSGGTKPEIVDPEWTAIVKEVDFTRLMQTAVNSHQIEGAFNSLLPIHPGYVKLRDALICYREIVDKGEWPSVPYGRNLQFGDTDERVRTLRIRLRFENKTLKGSIFKRNIFDNHLGQAVRLFQQQCGLDVDGIVGPHTLRALNIPAAGRVRQIELNMERWRWLPQYLGKRYVIVNIADFKLEIREENQLVIVMRAVVGQNYRRTPVFSTQMTHLVLNPYWNVPKIIAVEDMLPQIQMDPNYLNRQRLKVFQDLAGGATEINPETVDWKTVTAENFNYRFQQEPGPANALGRVKFMFPNKYDVYIHDTPSQDFFAKSIRNFSSGCIRIEKPIDLAEYLMQGDLRWTRENIIAAIDSGVTRTIRLPSSIPVYFIYWTAWAEGDGTVHFREDIYGRDRILEKEGHIKYEDTY
jgi:murein L,D-transpeptidase YcbB/YkuD